MSAACVATDRTGQSYFGVYVSNRFVTSSCPSTELVCPPPTAKSWFPIAATLRK